MSTAWIDTRTNPISLDEAKLHLRVDSSADDALISSLVSAASLYIEETTGRAMVSGTLEIKRKTLPSSIPITFSPVQSVVSVVITDEDGNDSTVDTSVYSLDTTEVPHRILLNSGEAWTTAVLADANPVTITVVAGYGPAASVPETLKAAVKLQVTDLYEQRASLLVGTIQSELPTVKRLLAPYRIRIEDK